MIYKRFDTIPYKMLIEILSTGDFKLLSDEETPEEELKDIWESIEREYMQQNPTDNEEKIIKYTKEVYYFETKHKQVLTFCEVLKFDYDSEVVEILKNYGYSIDHHNYLERVPVVEREANALLDKAMKFQNMIPKTEPGKRVTVDEMLASYGAILQIDFDYNTVTASKVVALGKQIDLKVKALERSQINQ